MKLKFQPKSSNNKKWANAHNILHYYHVHILAALWFRLDCHKPDAVRTDAVNIAPSAN
jgi:hypothetical protein